MVHAPKARRRATIADLEALPETTVGEIVDGTLYTSPRPGFLQCNTKTVITADLYGAFKLGRRGPGGWWIIVEPGIRLRPDEEISPDLGGWRRERMPEPPADGVIRIAPDWVCEILSPGTRRFDQHIKSRFYAREGVRWMWLVDPEAQTLLVHRLVEGQWLQVGNFGGDERVRAEPFEAVALRLRDWWGPPPMPAPKAKAKTKAKTKAAPRKKRG